MGFRPISPLPSSMDLEATVSTNPSKRGSWMAVLMLAYQSIGVVYGDLGTAPLYVFRSTFNDDIKLSESNEEIYGVLCFVFWTLTLIALFKYVTIVLWAEDNGEGGTFALYSLLCRHARIGFLPSGQLADEELSMYKKREDDFRRLNGAADRVKGMLERHPVLQHLLLILAMLGACVVIINGVLTPAISVFSAVSGFEFAMSSQNHQYLEVPVACALLVCLFILQHYGTHRVGFLFAPIIIIWLLCISVIGLYNIFYWNPHVYRALSPRYMYKFVKKTGKQGWMSLAGTLLCITGSEIVFVDMGHFSRLSLRIAFICFVYPLLILAYMGQAAYFSKHQFTQNDYQIGFYVTVPESIRWPVIGLAVISAVVGSQAVITGTFSIIKQCSALACFPRVKIIHTSYSVHGQIYIPEINWILMGLCLAVTIGFRETMHLGNASGLAFITGMLVTTCLMAIVITLCWQRNIFLALCFLLFFGTIELLYFSATLMKFSRGGWFSVFLSSILMSIMCMWRYGTVKRYEFDVQNKVSVNWLLSLAPTLGVVRVRGIGLIHTELVSGIPAIFSHFVTNLPAFHQVFVFLCVKCVHVPYVQPEERFLVGRIGAKEYSIYRCIVRYGYRDVHMDDVDFEKELISRLAEFIRTGGSELDRRIVRSDDADEKMTVIERKVQLCEDETDYKESTGPKKRVRFLLPESESHKMDSSVRTELNKLTEARESGMAFILPNSYVRAKSSSGWVKKIVVNYGYEFLTRNCRSVAHEVTIPHVSTLEVAMVYHV